MQLYSLQIEKFYHAGSGKRKVIPDNKLSIKVNKVICLPPGNECEEKTCCFGGIFEKTKNI